MQTPRDQCNICMEDKRATCENSAPIQKTEEKAEASLNNLGPVPEEYGDSRDQGGNWRDYKTLSDVDSITSHWRLDNLVEEPGPMLLAKSSNLQTETAHKDNFPSWTQEALYDTYENGVGPCSALYNPNHREGPYTGRYDHHRSSSPYIPWTAHLYFSPPINTSSSQDVLSNLQDNTQQQPVGNEFTSLNESVSRMSHREMVREQLAQAQQHNHQPQSQYYEEPSRNYQVWPGERTYGMGVPPHLWPALWPNVNRPFEPGAFDHLRSQMGNDESKPK